MARIRRLPSSSRTHLSKRPLPLRRLPILPAVTRKPLNGGHGATNLSSSFIRPNAASPPHPGATNSWFGLFKYSTSTLHLPINLKRLLEVDALALKVASSRPANLSKQRVEDILKRFSSEQGSTKPSLEIFFGTACQMYSLDSSIREVYLQGFVNRMFMKKTPARPHLQSTPPHQWHIICQMHRKQVDAACSRPLITIGILYDEQRAWCQLQVGRHTIRHPKFRIQIAGHLKHEVVDLYQHGRARGGDSGKMRSSAGMMQEVVNNMLQHASMSVKGQAATGDEMVARMKSAILTYLPRSPLAYLLDFEHLEVVVNTGLKGSGERFVDNSLLNADGIERQRPERDYTQAFLDAHTSSPLLQASEGVAAIDDASIDVSVEVGGQTMDVPLSRQTCERIGRPNLTATCKTLQKPSPGWVPQSHGLTLIEDFDQTCRTTNKIGISNFAAVALVLAHRFPHMRMGFYLNSSDDGTQPITVYTNHELSPNLQVKSISGVRLHLPRIKNLQISVAHGPRPSVDISYVKVSLVVVGVSQPSEVPAPQDKAGIGIVDETNTVFRMTEAVIRDASRHVEFDVLESAPQMIADALLRVVRFPSSDLTLIGASISIAPRNPHSASVLEAMVHAVPRDTPNDLDGDHTHLQGDPHIRLPVTPREERQPYRIEATGANDGKSSLATSKDIDYSPERAEHTLSSTASDLQLAEDQAPDPPKSVYSSIYRSTLLKEKTGCDILHLQALPSIADEFILWTQRTFNNGLNSSQRNGLFCYIDAAKTLFDSSYPGTTTLFVPRKLSKELWNAENLPPPAYGSGLNAVVHADGTYDIQIPGIMRSALHFDKADTGIEDFSINIHLVGSGSSSDNLAGSPLRSQIEYLYRATADTLQTLVGSISFRDTGNAAMIVARALLERRSRFALILDLQSVELRWKVRNDDGKLVRRRVVANATDQTHVEAATPHTAINASDLAARDSGMPDNKEGAEMGASTSASPSQFQSDTDTEELFGGAREMVGEAEMVTLPYMDPTSSRTVDDLAEVATANGKANHILTTNEVEEALATFEAPRDATTCERAEHAMARDHAQWGTSASAHKSNVLLLKTGVEKFHICLPHGDIEETIQRVKTSLESALNSTRPSRGGLPCFVDAANMVMGLSFWLPSMRLNLDYELPTELQKALPLPSGSYKGAPLYVNPLANGLVSIRLPDVVYPALWVSDPKKSRPFISIGLVGSISSLDSAETSTLSAQIGYLFRAAAGIIQSLVDSNTFDFTQDAMKNVAQAFVAHRSRFAAIVDVRFVEVELNLRKTGEQPVTKRATAVVRKAELECITRLDLAATGEFGTALSDEEAGVETNTASEAENGTATSREIKDTATETATETAKEGIYVALGSNMGDRLKNIEDACNLMDADPDIRILQTSSLYETAPMYVEDQDRFLNGACEIATSLQPIDLLDRLQAIEQKLGRVKIVEKGPRSIDLDILMYRDMEIKTERLVVPHPLMLERNFVVRPLLDIAPWYQVPGTSTTIHDAFDALVSRSELIYPQTPLSPGADALRSSDPKRRTQVMAILNATPDSFSDGGTHDGQDRHELRRTVKAYIAAGATIIDVGGQSSRPNAPDIGAEEEIARILPTIEVIRSLPEAETITISVDTYRAAVAEAAINAGAHVVNDISAGQLDADMLPTIARLGCTYVMMHMRGTPSTMQNAENCDYPEGLQRMMINELYSRIDAAMAAGIRRWRIVLDPGIGFSKTRQQNLTILKSVNLIRRRFREIPWLVGSSRKSFIGKITGVEEPKDRTWGTAATVTAAVRGGADIVRVHDVKEMVVVVKMADAIYRGEV